MENRQNGFTLIEVLIALVILAIAFTAIQLLIQNLVKKTEQVSEKIAAHWVAINVITEMQLGLIKKPNKKRNILGKSFMASQHWPWKSQCLLVQNKTCKKIQVVVLRNKQRLLQRRGFL